MIALIPAYDLGTLALTDFHLILTGQLQCSLNRFRPSAAKINRTFAKIVAGKLQQLARVLLGNWRGELASMDELQTTSLVGHRSHDFVDAMSNEVNCGRTREIEVLLPIGVPQVGAIAAHSRRQGLAERAPQQGRIRPILKNSLTRHVGDYPVY